MKLSNSAKLSFGIGALGKDLCYAIISYFLMIYFTDTVGLTPLFAGNLFLVARLWDAFNDPMMGVVPSVITVLAFVIYVLGYKLEGPYLEEIMAKIRKKNEAEKLETVSSNDA